MFERTTHRPWPIPTGPWIMKQTWAKLLFAHWPIDPNEIQSKIPAPLELDTYQGMAWITLVPFQMKQVRFRLLPTIPGARLFPELNVRTYVTHQGKRGVYFFKIDADHHLAVWAAKTLGHLPYSYAKIDWREQDQQIHFTCHDPQPVFEANYQPISEAEMTREGTLEHWLMERYCLYTNYHQHLYRGEIHHDPWFIQRAKVDIIHNVILDQLQLPVQHREPLFHYAEQLQVWAWPVWKCSR